MKPRFPKIRIRDLALAIGLPAALIALLLAGAAESAPPIAAAPAAALPPVERVPPAIGRTGPAAGRIRPAWTSTEPVTSVILPNTTWNIQPYSVTIKFLDGALREAAVFTFTPRLDLVIKADPPIVSTPYIFEFEGYFLSTGGSVSLRNDVRYTVWYEDSKLGGVSEPTLEAYRSGDLWIPMDATLDTVANRVTWETNLTGKFGIGGLGPRKYIYFPATFNSSIVRPR